MSNTVLRWNNLARRFDLVSVDKLDGRVHDLGDARPTRFMKKNEAAILEAQEQGKGQEAKK